MVLLKKKKKKNQNQKPWFCMAANYHSFHIVLSPRPAQSKADLHLQDKVIYIYCQWLRSILVLKFQKISKKLIYFRMLVTAYFLQVWPVLSDWPVYVQKETWQFPGWKCVLQVFSINDQDFVLILFAFLKVQVFKVIFSSLYLKSKLH